MFSLYLLRGLSFTSRTSYFILLLFFPLSSSAFLSRMGVFFFFPWCLYSASTQPRAQLLEWVCLRRVIGTRASAGDAEKMSRRLNASTLEVPRCRRRSRACLWLLHLLFQILFDIWGLLFLTAFPENEFVPLGYYYYYYFYIFASPLLCIRVALTPGPVSHSCRFYRWNCLLMLFMKAGSLSNNPPPQQHPPTTVNLNILFIRAWQKKAPEI